MNDFIIAGSGLTGSIIAHELLKKGYKCLIADKRDHIAGNVYSKNVEGIETHVYGPHIFHTNSERIWDYVNRFTKFNDYRHRVKALNNGKLYSLPFNLQTIYDLTGVFDPSEAAKCLTFIHYDSPKNLEEQALSTLGVEIYETLIRDYTIKQWGKRPTELPASIIKRIPWRFTFNDRYYNHRYEGIPVEGYTKLVENIQQGVNVALDLEITDNNWRRYGKRLIYTGPVDSFYSYCLGRLEYRSLRFKTYKLYKEYHQGCAQMNYCDMSVKYTRTIEHKHFTDVKTDFTLITEEYPANIEETGDRYYPIEDSKQLALYRSYKMINSNVIFAGRLGNYKYYDMDQAIASALKMSKLISEGSV